MVTFDRKRCRRMKKTEHNRDSHHDQQQNHAHCLRERAHWSVLLENRKTITFEKPTPPRQWSLKNDLSTFVIVFRYINSMLRGTIVLTRVLFIQTLTLLSGPEFNRYEERSPYTHTQANVYICTHTYILLLMSIDCCQFHPICAPWARRHLLCPLSAGFHFSVLSFLRSFFS